METKRDKFVRLTEKRMENVLKGISLLGNLANTSNYEYTEADAAKIIKTLKNALKVLKEKKTYNFRIIFLISSTHMKYCVRIS